MPTHELKACLLLALVNTSLKAIEARDENATKQSMKACVRLNNKFDTNDLQKHYCKPYFIAYFAKRA